MRILLIIWLVGLGLAWLWVRGRRKSLWRELARRSPDDAKRFKAMWSRFGVMSGFDVAQARPDERDALQARVNQVRIKVAAAYLVAALWPVIPALLQTLLGGAL